MFPRLLAFLKGPSVLLSRDFAPHYALTIITAWFSLKLVVCAHVVACSAFTCFHRGNWISRWPSPNINYLTFHCDFMNLNDLVFQ